jgi:hypothetical protein
MWEASWGIIAILAVMLFIGILSNPARGKSRSRSRHDFGIAKQSAGKPLDEIASINKREANQAASGTLSNSFTRADKNKGVENVMDIAAKGK